ncbi:MAG: glycerophosphodiester phosphodiesterase [Anaerolineae bacterium]
MLRKWLKRLGLGVIVLVAVLIVGYVVLVLRAQPLPDHPFNARSGVLVFAHQGGDGIRPSNTMAAFTHAVEIGADILDLDIHRTSDGVLVVLHDETVDRTTNGTGLVREMTLDDLRQLDAGYNWPTDNRTDSSGYPYRGQGITIPTLEEVFQAFPDMRVNIEIKQETPSIVADFCAMIHQYNMQDKTMVSTFHETTMTEFRQTCPDVPTAAVESEVRLFYVLNQLHLARAFYPTAYTFQVPETSGNLQVVTTEFVAAAAALNIQVYPWTINDAEGMQRVIDAGVQGINTDYPDVLLNLLGRS